MFGLLDNLLDLTVTSLAQFLNCHTTNRAVNVEVICTAMDVD
jgi:hypothetical protein